MKTLEEVLNTRKEGCIDGRDLSRLAQFVPANHLSKIGYALQEGVTDWVPVPWTRENILKQLENDVAFGFEKALNKRGISSSFMFEVVMMWNWVLEEGLETFDNDNYAQYGLPLYKATAFKYGFPNPIGDDRGDEDKYGEEY